MSSALLTHSSNVTNTTSVEANRGKNDVCDVTKMIITLQAISKDINGVVVYQDPKSSIPFSELKEQTEKAILSNFLIQGPSSSFVPKLGNSLHTRKRALEGVSGEAIMQRVAAIQEQHTKEALERKVLQKRGDASPSGNDVVSTTSIAPPLGIMALADPAMINILRTNAEPMEQAVIAQITFANNAFGPNLPFTPSIGMPEPTPTTIPERPIADRSLGLFFWVILGSVVLIIGVWYVILPFASCMIKGLLRPEGKTY